MAFEATKPEGPEPRVMAGGLLEETPSLPGPASQQNEGGVRNRGRAAGIPATEAMASPEVDQPSDLSLLVSSQCRKVGRPGAGPGAGEERLPAPGLKPLDRTDRDRDHPDWTLLGWYRSPLGLMAHVVTVALAFSRSCRGTTRSRCRPWPNSPIRSEFE